MNRTAIQERGWPPVNKRSTKSIFDRSTSDVNSTDKLQYATVLSTKLDDVMRKTLRERSERERKVRELLINHDKGHNQRNFLMNMR